MGESVGWDDDLEEQPPAAGGGSALILGVCAIVLSPTCCFGMLLALLAMTVGSKALARPECSTDRDKRLASVGFALGALGLALSCVSFVVIAVSPPKFGGPFVFAPRLPW